MTIFGTLHPDGSMTNVRTISQDDIARCPHLIFMPDHYRANGSCRCNDNSHFEMAQWGYLWDANLRQWVAANEED